MRLLLTSGGISNPSIHAALVDLLGKPVEECDALCIPTATYGHPYAGPGAAWRTLAGRSPARFVDLGWRSMGVLELSALPTLGEDRWVPWVRDADVLLCDGGDTPFLAHWMRHSGLADLLPSLPDLVWVGMSAGSMVMTPRVGDDFVQWTSPDGAGDTALGVVDFSIFPHLDHPHMPTNTLPAAERWAAEVGVPAYAIDDQTAIVWVDGDVEVVSEGQWHRLGG